MRPFAADFLRPLAPARVIPSSKASKLASGATGANGRSRMILRFIRRVADTRRVAETSVVQIWADVHRLLRAAATGGSSGAPASRISLTPG